MKKSNHRKPTWLLTIAAAYAVLPGCSDDAAELDEESVDAGADTGSTVLLDAGIVARPPDATVNTVDAGLVACPTIVGSPEAGTDPCFIAPGTTAIPPDASVVMGVMVLPPDAPIAMGVMLLPPDDASIALGTTVLPPDMAAVDAGAAPHDAAAEYEWMGLVVRSVREQP
jgi:hypothetical protein